MDEVFLSPDGRSHRGDLHRRNPRRTGPGSLGRRLRLGQYPEAVRLGEAQHPSGVDRNVLEKWKEDRQCRLFVISAIRPTRINVETILIVVDRLGLTDVFEEDAANIRVTPTSTLARDTSSSAGTTRRRLSWRCLETTTVGRRPSCSLMTNESTLTIFQRSLTIARVITSLRNK